SPTWASWCARARASPCGTPRATCTAGWWTRTWRRSSRATRATRSGPCRAWPSSRPSARAPPGARPRGPASAPDLGAALLGLELLPLGGAGGLLRGGGEPLLLHVDELRGARLVLGGDEDLPPVIEHAGGERVHQAAAQVAREHRDARTVQEPG